VPNPATETATVPALTKAPAKNTIETERALVPALAKDLASESAWTKVSHKPVKPAPKRFILPIAQQVKVLRHTKIPGYKTPHNTHFDVTLNLPRHEKPQKNFSPY
jgi:hypothetical protein